MQPFVEEKMAEDGKMYRKCGQEIHVVCILERTMGHPYLWISKFGSN